MEKNLGFSFCATLARIVDKIENICPTDSDRPIRCIKLGVADQDNFAPDPDPGSGFTNFGSGSCLNLI